MSNLSVFKEKIGGLEHQFAQVVTESQTSLVFKKEQSFAIQSISNSKYLQGCSVASVLKSVMNVALTGLSLNPVLGYAYLIPRKGTAVLDVSYKGMIKILTDTRSVLKIEAHVVYENDGFDMQYGSDQQINHAPCLIGDRGAKIGAYAFASLADGVDQFLFMRMDELEAVKNTSESKNSKYSPWQTFEDEMLKKTVVKRLYKMLPKTDRTEQLANVLEVDNQNAGFNFTKKEASFDDIIDDEAVVSEDIPQAPSPTE